MKKRITKLMSTLLCCVMLLGLFPTAEFAGAIRGGDQPGETAPDAPAATDLPTAYTVQCVTEGAGHTAVSVNQIADTASIGTVSQSGDNYVCPITVSTLKYADAYSAEVGKKHSAVNDSIFFHMTWKDARWVAPAATSLPAIDVECEYGVTYSYDNSVPAEVMATLPTNSYNYSVGQMVTTAAKPEDVTVGDYIWKFRTWQLNGVDVAPNTQIEMVQGGLTFTGVWTREAVMSAEYGVTYSYDNSVPAEVMATLPTNSYTYSVGQKVTTAAKPEDVVVGDYVWKFQTWQLNGVDVAPNTQVGMVQGGLTFTGIWTREAMMPAEYGVTYSYDNSVPAVVMATLPTNSYTYSVGQK
ncbi:MAG: SHIRT domain-containing protein, partial [Clostridiales bacterium]|nr:SHIRT domain-containing protein [Clostridiales bacterium]